MKVASILATLALIAVPACASAQNSPAAADQATVTVGGDGLVERSPDVARVSLTIVSDDADAARSTAKNNAIYNELKARAAKLGVAGEAVRTTFFNVQFVPAPPKGLPPEQRPARYGYITSRSLLLNVAPIENAGKVVDAATAAGVTDVGGIAYDLNDRKAAYREALAAAYSDAKANAAAIAQSGAFHIVRVKAVSSLATEQFGPQPVRATYRLATASAQAPPTELGPAGPISVPAHVQVIYEIR